uniref:Myb/SANT-like DNA-binding domain-containing protein n=1 Tax=Ciona savignyi TaxID=51511 RepID=H2Z9Z0_CIOSA
QSSPKDRENCRRSPNWSPTEIRTLCDFVQRHKAELFGTVKNTKGVNANKKKLWGEAASTISASSGRNRDWYQVR